jgi:hypothetical protein
VFKKYSHMKLQMKSEALDKINRVANEMTRHSPRLAVVNGVLEQFWNSLDQCAKEWISARAEML